MSPFELIRTETANDTPSNKGASVKRMCRLLEVSRSGYYDYLNRQAAPPPEREERLIAMIRTIHAECQGAYGVRRTHRELLEAGEQVSRKRVRRLMRDNGIRSVQTPKFIKTTRLEPRSGLRPELTQSAVRRRRPRPRVDRQHHLRVDGRGLVLPGRPARPVQPPCRRLGAR